MEDAPALADDSVSILRRFAQLPYRYRGREVVVDLVNNGGFHGVEPDECTALRMRAGDTIRSLVTTVNGSLATYGQGEIAERLLDTEKGASLRVTATTVFGVTKSVVWGHDGPVTSEEFVRGLEVKHILSVHEVDDRS